MSKQTPEEYYEELIEKGYSPETAHKMTADREFGSARY